MRVRIAPSPTGNLHIGTLRAALFNWLVARHSGGTFVLRVEDTDLERSKPEFEGNIFRGLREMGLVPDEGPEQGGPYAPYRQSERMSVGLYLNYADRLQALGHAYCCFCTDAELDTARQAAEVAKQPYVYDRRCRFLSEDAVAAKKVEGAPFVVRFKMPDNAAYHFEDIIRGTITFDLNLISDFVMIKSDGGPSYNFAVVVDDIEMAITHVVRGEDHISNTPRQLVIYEALGVIPPRFAHLPMILGPDRSKLSKRHGATSVSEYISTGYLPEALLNYLALLGWSSPDGQELMTREDIVRQFSLERVSKSGAIFDIAKLKWMNGQYIRRMSPEALALAVRPFLSADTGGWFSQFEEADQVRILYSVRDNLDVLSEINGYVAVYGFDSTAYANALSDVQFGDSDRQVAGELLTWLGTQPEIMTPEAIQAGLDHVLAQTQLPKGKVFKPIRLLCSGAAQGPHLPDLLSILPKSVVLSRLQAFVAG